MPNDATLDSPGSNAGASSTSLTDRRVNQFKPTVILLSSTVLMLGWKNFGTASFYSKYLADLVSFGHPDAMAAFYQFGSCLLLLGLVPALIIKFVFRERLMDYGLGLGIRLYTLRCTLINVPLFVIGGYLATSDLAIREWFPINKQIGASTPIWLHVFTYSLFYLGWEFHFRGFLQFGLAESMGLRNAILIQTMASALLHIGQPPIESFAAIGGGLLWGFYGHRTKSILAGLLQHIALGLAVDFAIVLGRG